MKHALVCFGNEESYGLLFVGGELKKHQQEFRYFDSEKDESFLEKIVDWKPDFVHFSPMTTFYPKALGICKEIKKYSPKTKSVFGGHHAISSPEICDENEIDIVVRGPVKNSIEKILEGEEGIIRTVPTNPSDLSIPARKEYFKDVPRMADRYRKIMISMLGCPFNCSYCSSGSGHLRERFGSDAFTKYFMKRRPLEDIFEEAKEIIKYPTEEIEWVDDDIFTGDEEWLIEFSKRWKKEIGLPMYVSTTSKFALKASDRLLEELRPLVNVFGMGIQTIRKESLKLFNRAWDNEERMKKAYDRLQSFGYNVNLQAIVGLPVDDPIEDALDTVKAMQRIGPGSIISLYPLEIYPNTRMKKIVEERGLKLNEECVGDTNTGITGIKFSKDVEKKLRNLCKLATPFVKYNIEERWMRALLDIEYDEKTSERLSMARYYECVTDRLKGKGEKIFEKIIKGMNIRH